MHVIVLRRGAFALLRRVGREWSASRRCGLGRGCWHTAVLGRSSRGCLPGLVNVAHGVAPAMRVYETELFLKYRGQGRVGLVFSLTYFPVRNRATARCRTAAVLMSGRNFGHRHILVPAKHWAILRTVLRVLGNNDVSLQILGGCSNRGAFKPSFLELTPLFTSSRLRGLPTGRAGF